MIIGQCDWRRRRCLTAARPRVVLHFHLSEGGLRTGHALVRPEDGNLQSLDRLVEFLGRTGCQVQIQPVLDPTEVAPIDGYEVPQRLRSAVRVRQIADVFPFRICVRPKMDLDHTERYVPSLSPDTSCTAHHPTDMSTWSPTKALLRSGRNDFSAAVCEISAPKPAAIAVDS
jgi:hypothetical protein